jgi:hypothetical protein
VNLAVDKVIPLLDQEEDYIIEFLYCKVSTSWFNKKRLDLDFRFQIFSSMQEKQRDEIIDYIGKTVTITLEEVYANRDRWVVEN